MPPGITLGSAQSTQNYFPERRCKSCVESFPHFRAHPAFPRAPVLQQRGLFSPSLPHHVSVFFQSKEQLVACARHMASDGQVFVRFGRLVAKNCPDKSCSSELLRATEQTHTISSQLGMVARWVAAGRDSHPQGWWPLLKGMCVAVSGGPCRTQG